MNQIFAIANVKGGVGKTTVTANLAAALSERGRQVLAVDLDPQASLTSSLGVKPETLLLTVGDSLTDCAQCIDALLVPTRENFDLVPSNHRLRAVERSLTNGHSRVYALREALNPMRKAYDFILLDCPAGVGILTGNALAAADQVIIPFPPDYLAMQSVDWLLRIVREAQSHLNPKLQIAGLLLAMQSPDTPYIREIMATAQHHFIMDIPFLKSEIPLNDAVKEAPLNGQSVVHFAPDSPPALAFRCLAIEIEGLTADPATVNAKMLVRRAREQLINGDVLAACRDYRRATESDPEMVEAWIGRAQTASEEIEIVCSWAKTLFLDSKHAVARSALSNHILNLVSKSRVPDIPDLISIGHYLTEANQLVHAEVVFRRITKLKPEHPGGWLGLALAAENSITALEYCERACRLDPENAEALSELESAKQRTRSQSEILTNSARSIVHTGRREDAHELFVLATELDPKNDRAWLGSARTSDEQHLALNFARMALQVNPDNEEAKSLHSWLWVPERESWEFPVGWQTIASISAALIIIGAALFTILRYLGM